jgi:hypothetical protein
MADNTATTGNQRVAQAAQRLAHSGGAVPKTFVGGLLILFFVMGSILHISTSEAFFNHGSTVGIIANWSILQQPYDLITGKLAPNMQESVMWGWGIELVFLICVVGYETAHAHVRAASLRMSKLFRVGSVVLIFFDGWTDFQYGNIASGFWGQLAFALITAFIVFFFGTIGWHLIARGLTEWGASADE